MTSNVDEFNASLDEFVATLPMEVAGRAKQRIGLAALTLLVKGTPVDTGFARAGWQVTLDQASNEQPSSPDGGGFKTINAGSAVIARSDPFADVFITNNVTYIEVLDAGRLEGEAAGEGAFEPARGVFGLLGRVRRRGATGSLQAPDGILGPAFTSIVEQFDEIVGAL